ncbi:FecR family protein [Chitinophaga japonensis]|uniref:FecR family protein n=1 Tax=Chitinophaga japonensis TaxID=104662 RepID=A0A562TD18_CHIJA|nr:FecR domain-containing protein [Chitinophaga japonensis]TWI91273.1 FecR family protein [Chitinophaga japonensis]
MEHSHIKRLFGKYLSGKAGQEEQHAVEQWYDRLEKRAPVQLSPEREKALEAAIWQRLEPRLVKRRRPFRRYAYISAAAASVALIITAGILFTMRNKSKTAAAPQFQDYVTGIGERKRLTLQDGTIIALNSATRLRIYTHNANARRVEITDGEAFFKVQHDPAHPFIIRSGSVTTRVLGTSFNIRAYKRLEELYVSVQEGKVQVLDSLRTLGVLGKQQKLVFNQRLKTWSIQGFDGEAAAWQQGKLLFKNTSFREMALLMQQNYGIYITAADDRVRQQKFTASVPVSLSAIKAAEVLASIHQFKIKQRRDTITLYR